jgi:hypothetical protein
MSLLQPALQRATALCLPSDSANFIACTIYTAVLMLQLVVMPPGCSIMEECQLTGLAKGLWSAILALVERSQGTSSVQCICPSIMFLQHFSFNSFRLQ